ncbi:MAG: dicarboxylate/amino acid:cation symporter [Bacteroidaceae bacterium]|nr:dicarboxylate/amino acid:cation symporter [Bacteroidaceae bacterium]
MKILKNTTVLLLLAVAIGIAGGMVLPASMMNVVLLIKQITGQLIFFLVPLIIFGFVAPSIAQLSGNVSKLLLFVFSIAYMSSVGAAFFGAGVSRVVVPMLDIPQLEQGRALPELPFQLEIPPLMSVMTALVIAVFIGLGSIWVDKAIGTDEKLGKCNYIKPLLGQFQHVVLLLVKNLLIPILPFYIAANFAALSYQGSVSAFTVFLPVLICVLVCHYIWLALLYGVATLYSGKSGWQVLRHYGPAYMTALGTMSSAATLGVALECAGKSSVLDKKVKDFAIPLFSNIHLCGSILTEVFFIAVVSQLIYGTLPDFATLSFFILLLGLFAIGAPGVPGGTVLASLGIVISVLGFDDAGTALLIAIFALQDSFGTACNVTGDGALTLITTKFAQKE